MDVTPKTLREVVFREKLRGGYHPDDVDEFLEQVASGVEVLHDRLRQAVDRAQRAEASATSSSDHGGEGPEEAVRTLVLAQRTADMTLREAREQAARIMADAEQQAQSVVTSAEERARRHEEATLSNSRAELTKMEATRAQAQQEVEALNRWIEEHKAHLASTLHDALSVVERSGAISPPPTSRPIEGVRREPTAPPSAAARAEPTPAESPSAPEAHQQAAAEAKDGAQTGEVDPTVVSPGADRSGVTATINADALSPKGANEPAPATSGGGGGDPIDPAEQALDEFFDDPEFADDDDRRFGGRLRRRR